jgi:hypothetical protein
MTEQKVNFESLNLPIPEIVSLYSYEEQKEIYDYLKQMDRMHIKSYLIAKDHLGSSFNIYKSNGFKEWKKSKQQT